MIRTILTAVFVVLFLIFSILLLLVAFIIGKFNMRHRDRFCRKVIQIAFRIVYFLAGAKVTVSGQENIPKDKAVLYIGNHRSYFDIVIGYTLLPDCTGFVAKKEMEKIPLLSSWMRMIHCLFLDRKNIKEGFKTILQGIEQIKSGTSVWIFPEGTRNRNADGQMLPFKEGSLKIAEKSGCAIVPVAFSNTADVFEAHLPYMRKTQVHVTFGKPFYIRDLDKEDRKFAGAYTKHLIEGMLAEAR